RHSLEGSGHAPVRGHDHGVVIGHVAVDHSKHAQEAVQVRRTLDMHWIVSQEHIEHTLPALGEATLEDPLGPLRPVVENAVIDDVTFDYNRGGGGIRS